MSKKSEIEGGGKKRMVSNLETVLYPETGFTKEQIIDYYIRIAPVVLPRRTLPAHRSRTAARGGIKPPSYRSPLRR